ncbi:hypothetical protein D3C80_762690 [compost metagenome]
MGCRAYAHWLQWHAHFDRTAVRRIGTEDQAQQFSTPRPDQAADAEYLALAHLEGHIKHLVRPTKALDCKQRLAELAHAKIKPLIQSPPDHEVDQAPTIETGHGLDTHQPAVAQHRDTLGDTRQLFQAMGYIDDGHATAAQAFDLGEQQLDLT